MKTEFLRALASTSEHDDAERRISIIKNAVRHEVSAVDPVAEAHFTDYFNHSIAPDMVLRWPGESKERFLFVRPSGDPGWLLNDLRLISDFHPLVFSLEDLSALSLSSPPSARQSLEERASAGGTWVTDSSGTDAMASARTQSPVLGMLSQALVRGGRGVSDGQEIRSLTQATEDGFYAASSGSAPVTASAVQAIEGHLNAEQSGRLTRLLRTIWEAHGGDEGRFPTTSSLGRLTADDLSYILKITSGGSADFWRRLGRSVSTELLAASQVEDPSENLQALVSASLEVLQAKGVRLIDEPFRLDEHEDFPRWVISRRCLALRGLNWTAYVAARKSEELPSPGEPEAPDLRTLKARADVYNVRIKEVQLTQADRTVTYESKEGVAILGDRELSLIEADLSSPRIEKAAAVMPDGGSLDISFRDRSAAGLTSATFLLGPLMRSALPLLADFSKEELANLGRVLRGSGYQRSLFPQWPDEEPED